jgi:GNAT superfamily N-acetyltransferase
MLIIRDASPQDAIEVAAVHVRAWQASYSGLLGREYLDRLRPEDRAARYDFGAEDPRTIVAIERHTITGFASIGASRDQDTAQAGEVYALYVDPPHWGEGIGRALMAHASQHLRARGFTEAILWVLAGNERAASFYRGEGWSHDSSRRREDIWGVNVEVLRYRRTLQPAAER